MLTLLSYRFSSSLQILTWLYVIKRPKQRLQRMGRMLVAGSVAWGMFSIVASFGCLHLFLSSLLQDGVERFLLPQSLTSRHLSVAGAVHLQAYPSLLTCVLVPFVRTQFWRSMKWPSLTKEFPSSQSHISHTFWKVCTQTELGAVIPLLQCSGTGVHSLWLHIIHLFRHYVHGGHGRKRGPCSME